MEVVDPAGPFPRRWAVAASLAGIGVLVAGIWMAGPLPRPELPEEQPAQDGATFTYPDFPNLPETETRRTAPISNEISAGTTGSLRSRIRSLDAEELRVLLAHEQAHGNRPQVLRAINQRFWELPDHAG